MSNTISTTQRRCIVATTTQKVQTGLSHTFLSPEEVAGMLPGISKGTLAMWRHEGRGPRYRKLGRIVLYALDEVEAWIEAGVRDGTSDDY
jgi:excisionase family DNA binding protein